MATITEEYKTGTGTSRTFTTQYINETDIKVRVNGGAPLTFSTGTLSTGQYNIASNATTITFGDSYSGTDVLHIYSETDVSSPTVTFTPGSSIKAADLNSLETLVRHGIKENRNQIIDQDIRDGVITSDHIKDGTLVDADISGSAAIAQSKLATGNLPSGITVNSANIVDGSIVNADVSPSANIQGSKLADDSVPLTKLGSGSLPSDITISDNYVNRSIKEEDIQVGALDNRYYTETELDAGQLDNRYYTEDELRINGAIDSRYYTETELDGGVLDTRYFTEGELSGGALDNRYYTETELDAGQLDNRYYTEAELNGGKLNDQYFQESELTGGALDGRYYTETELDAGQLDTRYYTEAELNGGKLNDQYFQESELTGGALDGRYYTETELDAGQLDNRYFTETELTTGALDGRYYTETEAEALFLRQDSSETIASGVAWSSGDTKVATTAAIDARIIDLLDDTGGFVPLANETSFPAANPDINNGNGTVVSVKAVSTNLTPSGGTVTITNGAGAGNDVTITGVTGVIPSGFGMILETTSTLHTYAFHRLQAKATEVNTVASNITQVVACGNNLADIENFADLYQISTSAPTQRADGGSLTVGDLWFDSSSNQVMMVYDGSTGDGFSPITPSQATITNINSVSGYVTYQEDLGNITDAVNTGAGNNSINTVGANIAAVNTVAADLNEATSEIDTVATNITNVNIVGNDIANVNAVAGNQTNIDAVKNNATNINAVNANKTNIDAVAANNANITAVKNNETNINAVKNNSANINAAVANASNINAAVANASDITTVSGISSNVTTVANNTSNINSAVANQSNINSAVANATNINTVSASIADVNRYAAEYLIQSGTPSGPSAGDLWYNSTANTLNYYTGGSWVGISPGIAGLINDANPQLANHLDCNDKNLTEEGTVSGNNLQIDFGTL